MNLSEFGRGILIYWQPMNFLEKDLETIVWENYVACAEKGLAIDQNFFQHGKCYRQLNLAPYGIADLIYIHYSAGQGSWHIQIIELKRGKIDMAAYQQAKRYQTALHDLLRKSKSGSDQTPLIFTTVLIGNEVETKGDFTFVLNYDFNCLAFTYSYGFHGIEFKEIGKEWRHEANISVPSTIAISADLTSHRAEITAGYEQHIQQMSEYENAKYGDYTSALLITSEGVLLNEDLLALPEAEDDADGN